MKNSFALMTMICWLVCSGRFETVDAQTRAGNKPKANASKTATTAQKTGADEPEPQKVDSETARSPVYKINSKHCRNRDEQASEGDDFVRCCKGFGGYSLWASGFGNSINYRIESDTAADNFSVSLFPLEDGEAAKFERADLYAQKLGDIIEWRLDKAGKPFAIVIRAKFYKNTGSAKTVFSPKNKVAEFVFVRGLKGFEDLKIDLATVKTAFNPDEQARSIAAEYLEKRRK